MTRFQSSIALCSFMLFAFVIMITSCSNPTQKEKKKIAAPKVVPNIKHLELKTRSSKKKVAARAYYHKNIVSFSKGKPTIDLKTIADLTNTPVNLVVLYEARAPWAQIFKSGVLEITGNQKLNRILDTYGLQITQQFAIDNSNEGIVMEPLTSLEDPLKTAQDISEVDHVLMVHIKELPQSHPSEEIAKRAK